MPSDPDTIVAISTPPGRGGIGIVRLSGPRAVEIAAPLLRLRTELAPARARFCEILDLTPSPSAPPSQEAVISTGARQREVERPPHLSFRRRYPKLTRISTEARSGEQTVPAAR
jgi:hypothetical protein